MIYTIGHRANYLANLSESETGQIVKLAGGYAFRTREDAERRIVEEEKVGVWDIFGLDADWDRDTEPSPTGGWWHNLLVKARIILLDDNEVNSAL